MAIAVFDLALLRVEIARSQLRLVCSQLHFGRCDGKSSHAPPPLSLAADQPHLVFFMADDTGWNNVGWHNPDVLTPHADALVAEGVELDRHYAFVYCSPSRSSFMTGRLPYHVQQINRQNCDTGQGVASST